MVRINKNCAAVFFILLLSTYWKMNDYIGNGITQIIEDGARVFVALYSVFLYMKNRKENKKISLFFLFLILMQSWLLLSTFYNRGSLRGCLGGYFCPLIAIGILFENMTINPNEVIQGSMLLSEILVYTNLITIFLFPNGMYNTYRSSMIWSSKLNWLLGNRNDFIPFFLFFALIAFIYRYHGGKRWREWGIYITCLLSVILVNSSTSLVGFISLLIAFLIIKSKKIKFNIYLLVSTNIILFLVIVVFRLQNLFSFLIEDVLGKNLTFTGRTILWDALMPIFKDNLLLGLGIRKSGELQKIMGIVYAGHAHNLILNLLYRGGIVYLGLYLTAMFLIYRQLHKYQLYIESQAVAVTLFVFQIIALMEPYDKAFFIYAVYFIAYYIDRFILRNKPNELLLESEDEAIDGIIVSQNQSKLFEKNNTDM